MDVYDNISRQSTQLSSSTKGQGRCIIYALPRKKTFKLLLELDSTDLSAPYSFIVPPQTVLSFKDDGTPGGKSLDVSYSS